MGIRVREVYSNIDYEYDQDGEEIDKCYTFGECDWYEPYTDDRGELFRKYQREYGRCDSTIYKEVRSAVAFNPPVIRTYWGGWHFVKRRKFEDCEDTYLQGTWVMVEGYDLVVSERREAA